MFLSQSGTNDHVTHDKFKIMVAIYLNLGINWSRLLVSNMKVDIKKVDQKFNDNDLLLELNVKRRLNFCSKISLIFQAVHQQAEWPGARTLIQITRFRWTCDDSRCLHDHSVLTATPTIRPFLVEMGRSNPMWVEPRAVVEGEQATNSPAAKKRLAPTSSS